MNLFSKKDTNSTEIKAIMRKWADGIDNWLDVIAHDGWDGDYLSSAIGTVLDDRNNPVVQNDPVAQYIVELADKAEKSGKELIGPALTALNLVGLYLSARIDGFGYTIRMLTEEGSSFAEVTIRPDRSTAIRAASTTMKEFLNAELAAHSKHGSTQQYADSLLKSLEKKLPIETDSEHSGPIVRLNMERQGFVDGKPAHDRFLYSPNAAINALTYTAYEMPHYYRLIKPLPTEKLDALCDALLVDQKEAKKDADNLADGNKAHFNEDDRQRFYLMNIARGLIRCDREDFYRYYSEIVEGIKGE